MANPLNTLGRWKALCQAETLNVATLKRLVDIAADSGGDAWIQAALDGAGITLVQWQALVAAITAESAALEATSGAHRKALQVFGNGSTPTGLLSSVRGLAKVLGQTHRDTTQILKDAGLMATAAGQASAGDWLNGEFVADSKTKAQFNASRVATVAVKDLMALNGDAHATAYLVVEGEG